MNEESSTADVADAESSGGPPWAILVFAAVVFAGIGFVYFFPDALRIDTPSGGEHQGVGAALPTLQLEPLLNAGGELQLDDLAGNVTLVNYWGPWCPPCRMEMPHLVELQQELADQPDFRFVSVACSGGAYGSIEQLRDETAKYADSQQITFPIYHDESAVSRRALSEAAGLGSGFSFPTTVLLDRESRIVGLWEGYSPEVPDEIREKILETLGT